MATAKKTSKGSPGKKSIVKMSDLKPKKDAKGGFASKRSSSNVRVGRKLN